MRHTPEKKGNTTSKLETQKAHTFASAETMNMNGMRHSIREKSNEFRCVLLTLAIVLMRSISLILSGVHSIIGEHKGGTEKIKHMHREIEYRLLALIIRDAIRYESALKWFFFC